MPIELRVVRSLHTTFYMGIVCALLLPSVSSAQALVTDEDGTTHVPAFVLPESSFLTPDARSALRKERAQDTEEAAKPRQCPPTETADRAQLPAIRQCEAEEFYKSAGYELLRKHYPVTVEQNTIGGVLTEVFMPTDGGSPKNRQRVLINLHGGAFICCARTESHSESVPIASTGKIRVISIDYRQAPEYTFPAASDDVVAVYRELLKTYLPKNIGIFGCSAGGLLTAESIARFQQEKLPLPGAAGMFCEGGAYWTEGDSGNVASALGWWRSGDTIGANPYFKNTNPTNPLAFPARSAKVMAGFPPSLLITASRDVALSSAIYTHALLRAGGVDAELRIWEGMDHGFFVGNPYSTQAREAYDATVQFFDKHLGH
jgi:monoterpene epsilon-lactone hydrolase